MKNSKHDGAKQAFFYLTAFLSLFLLSAGVTTLFFQIINALFPDPNLAGYAFDSSQGALKFGIAAIVITAPVYYLTMRVINRSLSKKDIDQDSGIRRWLTYIVLFVTVSIIIGDLISLLYSFLDGDLTMRFVLKSASIFLIAGAIVMYYFLDMHHKNEKNRRQKNRIWTGAFAILVLMPFVSALFLVDSPEETRAYKQDQETIQILQQIQGSVENYMRLQGALPESLLDLEGPQYYLPSAKMQEQARATYQTKGQQEYELCADFVRASTQSNDTYLYNAGWQHDVGRECFALTAPDFELRKGL